MIIVARSNFVVNKVDVATNCCGLVRSARCRPPRALAPLVLRCIMPIRRFVTLALLAALWPSVLQAQSAPLEVDTAASRPSEALHAVSFGRLEAVADGLDARRAGELAAAYTPNVDRQQAGVAQALSQQGEARLGYLPRFEASVRYTHLSVIELPPLNFGGQEIANPFPQINNLYTLRGTVTLPVSDWFLTVRPAAQAAGLQAEAATWQVEIARQDAAWQAQQAWYGWLLALGAIDVSEQSLVLVRSTLTDVQSLFEAGQATRADIARVESAIASAELQVLNANNNADAAAATLRTLLGLESGAPLAIAEDVTGPLEWQAPTLEALVERAQNERAEVQAIRTAVQALEWNERLQGAGMLPRFAVAGNLDIANPNTRYNPQDEVFRTTWDATAQVTWSPNDFAAARRRQEQVQAQAMSLEADLQYAQDGIAIEARDAWMEWQTAQDSLSLVDTQLRVAEEEYRTRRELAFAGVAPASELTESLLSVTQARFAVLQVWVQQRAARARIERVMQASVAAE